MRVVLRPYQSKAVAEVMAYFGRGIRGVVLESPVGSGKTCMGMDVVDRMISAGLRGIWMANRVELTDQASERADIYGIPHGRIMPGHDRTGLPFHIASIDTLDTRLDDLLPWLGGLDFAVWDEVHHIVSDRWTRTANALRRAYKLGLTATPFRLDGRGLGESGHLTATVSAPGIKELTALGFLAPAVIYAPETNLDLSKVKKTAGEYSLGQMAEAVSAAGLEVIGRRWYARHAGGRPAVVFCTTVEQAERSAAAYRAAGWLARSVDGSMSARERAAAVNGLADGSVQVLTSCALLGEGFDCPEIAAAILERPTASTGLHIQMIGRALRPHRDKSQAVILDLVGNTAAHGLYDEPRPWSLKDGIKGQERNVCATRLCPRCYRVHAWAETCPGCRLAYPRTAKPAAGQELWRQPGAMGLTAEQIKTTPTTDLMTNVRSLDDVRAIARIKGFNPGWVKHIAANDPRFSRAAGGAR